MRLATRLLSQLGGEHGHDAETAVERIVAEAIDEAGRRWPGVTVDLDAYVDWLAARVPGDTAVEAALARLRLAELLLTCACAAGSAAAIAAFDAEFIARDRRTSDDEKQLVRQKLFLADGDTPPRVARYGGRGDLGRWVRTVATRVAIDSAPDARELPTDDDLLKNVLGVDPGHGPELTQLKADARKIVQDALAEAFAGLPARERMLLLQYHLDGVGVVELGRQFNVAPSTISRNLARIRGGLLAQVRRSLMYHHKLWGEELERLLEFAQSQLSVNGALGRT